MMAAVRPQSYRELEKDLAELERQLERLRTEVRTLRVENRAHTVRFLLLWSLPALWRKDPGYSPDECADDLEVGLRAGMPPDKKVIFARKSACE